MKGTIIHWNPTKSALGALALAVLVAAMLTCFAPMAQAKEITLENAKGTVHMYPDSYKQGQTIECMINILTTDPIPTAKPKIVKITGKKPKVSREEGSLWLGFKKAGTRVVTYKWKGVKHKVKFVVHTWKNPLKSLKVGDKQYKNLFNKESTAITGEGRLSGKIVLKPAKGWKLQKMEWYDMDTRAHRIKNKKTLEWSKNAQGMFIYMQNKKSGQIVVLDLW